MNHSSLFGPGVESVWNKGGRKKRGKKQRTGLTAGSNLPPELAAALGEAELHFINGENERAIELLSEVSMKAPKLPDPYSIMAIIYEASGDQLKALQLHALTATYTPKNNFHLWTKVADLACEIGELDQAILALKKCIKIQSSPELYHQKIRVFIRQKNLGQAKSTLKMLLGRFKEQESFLVEFGDLVYQIGFHDLAIDSYARYIFHLLGTTQVRTELFPTAVLKANAPAKSNTVLVEHADRLFAALYRAVDALVDKPDRLPAAMELIELCGEWTLAYRASLPPDATRDNTVIPELPLLVVLLYAGDKA